MLRRRPDIRVTERNLAEATANVRVVTADLFPRVTLAGSVALQAGSFLNIGKGGSDTFAVGPSIFWAAFDLGRVGPVSEVPMREPKGSGAIRAARLARARGNGKLPGRFYPPAGTP